MGIHGNGRFNVNRFDRDSNAAYRDEKLSGIGYASLPCGIISSTLQRLAVLFAISENIKETKSDDFSV